MIKRLIYGLTFFYALTNCSDKPKTTDQKENEKTKVDSFVSIYDTLDQMQIPVTLTPDSWGDLYYKHLEKYGTREGDLPIDHPYARLVENKNYKAFIFVSTDETGSPVVMTFDRNGNVIDDIWLLGNWGGNDPSFGTVEMATINKDLTIHLLDSASTYDLGPDGDRIDSTRKLTVTDELYKILDSGVIEKIR